MEVNFLYLQLSNNQTYSRALESLSTGFIFRKTGFRQVKWGEDGINIKNFNILDYIIW